MRTALTAAIVCLVSWCGLLVGAGNIGLQRSVAVSPLTLLEVPAALALSFVLSLATALFLGRSFIGARPHLPLRLVAWVLVGDLFGAGVLAPVAVGELTVMTTPAVFAAITALGLQPLGATLGALLASARAPVAE